MIHSLRESKGPLLVGTGTILAILIAYACVSFSVNTNDLAAYIQWSYALPEHISYESHMPGLPAVLAAGRFITFGMLPDPVIAQLISYIAWLVSVLLANELLKLHPALKVLYVTGYPDEVVRRQGIDPQEVALIQKPFDNPILGSRVRDVLDSKP